MFKLVFDNINLINRNIHSIQLLVGVLTTAKLNLFCLHLIKKKHSIPCRSMVSTWKESRVDRKNSPDDGGVRSAATGSRLGRLPTTKP